jgi:hypothetical protein
MDMKKTPIGILSMSLCRLGTLSRTSLRIKGRAPENLAKSNPPFNWDQNLRTPGSRTRASICTCWLVCPEFRPSDQLPANQEVPDFPI